jgi:hypothetical protein
MLQKTLSFEACVMYIAVYDYKASVHLMITIQKVASYVQSVPLQSPDIY